MTQKSSQKPSQALQSTEVTILKSEEYCYEKHQSNADLCLAGITETLR